MAAGAIRHKSPVILQFEKWRFFVNDVTALQATMMAAKQVFEGLHIASPPVEREIRVTRRQNQHNRAETKERLKINHFLTPLISKNIIPQITYLECVNFLILH